jgi:phospholipid/cholesterol/gamma-HCH transport system substrate-binding protein
MSERAHEFKIGAFVLVGLLLIMAGLVAFAFSRDVEPVYKFETYVDGDVDGLSVGSSVKLRGVDVGQVTSIRFSWVDYPPGNPRCVVIRFTIARAQSPIAVGGDVGGKLQEAVASGLRAVVQGQGITGTSILALKYVDPKEYPPLEFSWTPKSLYIPSAPSEFSQIITAVTRVMSSLDKVNFEAIGNSVQTKLDDINTKAISDDLQRTLSEARKAINDIRGEVDSLRLAEIGKNTNGLLLGLQDTNGKLERTAGRLSNLDFRNLNDTLAGTRDAVRNLNDALDELKRYPAGFLFGDPPPPAAALSKEKK